MIKAGSQAELSILCCGKCGAEILRIGDNLQVVIPSVHYKCFNCGSVGVFDKVFGDTTKEKNEKDTG